jgi:hypothetical protein
MRRGQRSGGPADRQQAREVTGVQRPQVIDLLHQQRHEHGDAGVQQGRGHEQAVGHTNRRAQRRRAARKQPHRMAPVAGEGAADQQQRQQ